MVTIIGLDLSVNHAGIVVLKDNAIDSYFINPKKKYSNLNVSSTFIALPQRQKDVDIDNYAEVRKLFIGNVISNLIEQELTTQDNIYISLEDYAYGSHSAAMTSLAEMIGHIKAIIFNYQNAHIRLHDPNSVKKFATGNGIASKRLMVTSAKENGFDISEELIDVLKKKTRTGEMEFDGPATDLADAFWLAKMLQLELALRAGTILLEDLLQHKRDLFLRVTKKNPINILARPFISYQEHCHNEK